MTTVATFPRVLSATSITGTDVENSEGQNLGNIKDIMIDTNTGRVEYVVLSFGGFLGMGDKLFAVPMKTFNIEAEDESWILDVSKDRLKESPGFDKNNWPTNSNDDYWNRVNSYYDYQPPR